MSLSRACGLVATVIVIGVLPAFGQAILQPGTVVTGTCSGHEKDPGCVLPNAFGPEGLTLFNAGQFPHYAHFTSDAQELLNQAIGTAIATQLVTLPIISPASGFTYRFDSASGAFVRSTESFGPIYAERAETIGRGKFTFGVSYQRFRFTKLDGIDLKNVPATFGHIQTNPNLPWEVDVIRTNNNISLKMDQTVLYGTVGLTNRLDLSVAIPIVHASMNTTSVANVVRVSGTPLTLPTGQVIANPHAFDAGGSLQRTYTSGGSASGIGDVTFRVKAGILNRERFRVAALMDIRTPSGDAQRLLGSGATGIRPFVAISTGTRVSPHLNLGYQWNSDSILAGNITGVTFANNAAGQVTITNGPQRKGELPGNLFYTAGVDIGATRRLTLGFDYIGLTVFDAPQIRATTFTTRPGPGATTTPHVQAVRGNMGLNNGSVGLKYNLFGRLLVTGNVLFRMDDNGLRQNVTPLVALSYAFE